LDRGDGGPARPLFSRCRRVILREWYQGIDAAIRGEDD
jgi:hypothetical protein